MKPAYILAFIILVISMGFVMWTIAGATAQHVTIKDAITRMGETVQVPGVILKETVSYDAQRGGLRFDIVDRKDRTARMTVIYSEPKPENFDSATQVEAVGQYKDGVFHAKNLLVKCPSKYRDDQPAKGQVISNR